MSVIKMTDLDLAGKRVFIRADLNVPVKDGKVTSDARIRASLPTIELALKQGAKVMVTSHLGRPTEGEYNEEFSLLPVVNYLKDKLSNPVRLVKDYLDGVEVAAGELVVLENVRVATEFSETATATLKSVNDIKDDEQILDLGDVSAQKLADILKNAKTILWNGPVGVFEFPNFRKGTEIVANAIADSEGFSIAGGGDTLAAIDLFGIADKISYISTGGGAFLEFVEGKVLPAVAMLEERAKQ